MVHWRRVRCCCQRRMAAGRLSRVRLRFNFLIYLDIRLKTAKAVVHSINTTNPIMNQYEIV